MSTTSPNKFDGNDAILVDSLSKSFAARRAGLLMPWSQGPGSTRADDLVLRNCSFRVGAGEVVGVIGNNGAGKSTLLRILARVLKPSAGTARLRGRVLSLLDLTAGFHRELSVRDNLEFCASTWGIGKQEMHQSLDAVLRFADYKGSLNRPVRELSTGTWLRLALSAGLQAPTDILLLDEVLSVGDIHFRAKCREFLSAPSSRTILLVSHETSLLEDLSSRVLWLAGGTIVGDGPAQEVLSRYRSMNSLG